MKFGEKHHYIGIIIFLIISGFTHAIYSAGINDAFYFDDYSNLNALNDNGAVDSLESARQFVFGNASGPTGRPISMATFLLDDNTWPSQASHFKETNILIHIIVGFLIFWLSYLISSIKKIHAPIYIAIFVAAYWMLNPLNVSTVLYPVQRMAQLSALFSILAMILYIKGRQNLSVGKIRLGFCHFLAVAIIFLLAMYSKENAIVLPALLIVIELWLFRCIPWGSLALKRITLTLMSMGAIAVVGFIVYKVVDNGIFNNYQSRDFSPYERLITQPSILLYYLKELFLPSLYTQGLYYDDRLAFTGIFEGWYSFSSLVLLLSIISVSIFLYRKSKVTGFALVFFFAAHIVESTGLNLELVFEHRNYLPSIFLGFVWIELALAIRSRIKFWWVVPLIPLLIFPVILHERSTLWSEEVNFGAFLAKSSPYSTRAHIELNNALLYKGRAEEAKQSMRIATGYNPDNVYLRMHSVLVDCLLNEKDTGNLEALLQTAKEQPFDGRNRLAIEKLWQYMQRGRCDFLTPEYYSRLLNAFLEQSGDESRVSAVSERLLRVYADRFYVVYPELSSKSVRPLRDILESDNPEYLMIVAAYLADVARYREALSVSDRALELVEKGVMGTSSRSQSGFELNIKNFQDTVKADLDQSGGR